jgi:hypothetical protein
LSVPKTRGTSPFFQFHIREIFDVYLEIESLLYPGGNPGESRLEAVKITVKGDTMGDELFFYDVVV